jgi:CRP-like cAMP-binding protein
MQSMETILAEHPFVKGLTSEHLALLAGCASNERFAAGELLFEEGAPADHLFLVRQGKIAVEISTPGKGSIALLTIGQGDIIGWSWLVPPYRRRFSARAVELTRAIGLDGRCLREKCEQDVRLGYALLSRLVGVMAQRLEASRLQLLDLYGPSR